MAQGILKLLPIHPENVLQGMTVVNKYHSIQNVWGNYLKHDLSTVVVEFFSSKQSKTFHFQLKESQWEEALNKIKSNDWEVEFKILTIQILGDKIQFAKINE